MFKEVTFHLHHNKSSINQFKNSLHPLRLNNYPFIPSLTYKQTHKISIFEPWCQQKTHKGLLECCNQMSNFNLDQINQNYIPFFLLLRILKSIKHCCRILFLLNSSLFHLTDFFKALKSLFKNPLRIHCPSDSLALSFVVPF